MKEVIEYLDNVVDNANKDMDNTPTNSLLGEFNRGYRISAIRIQTDLSPLVNNANESIKTAYYKTGDIISFLAGCKMDILSGNQLSEAEFSKAIALMYDIQKLINPKLEKIQ